MAAYTSRRYASGSAAAPVDVDIAALAAKTTPSGTDLLLLSDQAASGTWRKVPWSSLPSGGGGGGGVTAINITNFTTSGTYTPPANLLYAIFEVVGGGGGGGGVTGKASCYIAASGGAGGGYARVKASKATIGASAAVTVGAGGTAGPAGGNGGSGGTSLVASAGSVTLASATGGAGGQPSSDPATSVGGGSAAGVGTAGDVAWQPAMAAAVWVGDNSAGVKAQSFYCAFGGSSLFAEATMGHQAARECWHGWQKLRRRGQRLGLYRCRRAPGAAGNMGVVIITPGILSWRISCVVGQHQRAIHPARRHRSRCGMVDAPDWH